MKRDLKNFAKTKNENFQQSHSAKKSERREPLGFFNIRSVAKYQKKEGRMKIIMKRRHEKNCEKSHQAKITCTKNFGQGRDSNQRPSAWQTSNNPN